MYFSSCSANTSARTLRLCAHEELAIRPSPSPFAVVATYSSRRFLQCYLSSACPREHHSYPSPHERSSRVSVLGLLSSRYFRRSLPSPPSIAAFHQFSHFFHARYVCAPSLHSLRALAPSLVEQKYFLRTIRSALARQRERLARATCPRSDAPARVYYRRPAALFYHPESRASQQTFYYSFARLWMPGT